MISFEAENNENKANIRVDLSLCLMKKKNRRF